MTIGGGLGGEIGFDAGRNVTVADVNVSTVAGSQEAVSILDGALKAVDSQRASLGAFQNRFGHAISNLDNVNETSTRLVAVSVIPIMLVKPRR